MREKGKILLFGLAAAFVTAALFYNSWYGCSSVGLYVPLLYRLAEKKKVERPAGIPQGSQLPWRNRVKVNVRS